MDILDDIKKGFQHWLLIQRDKYFKKEISKIPSDNVDDYYFDNLTNSFVSKDSMLNVQIGWENTLNVVKTKIETLNLSVENLEAIIDDIAQVNIDTTALTAIIANIGTINTNVNNLQATIANIANVDANITNLQAIIANIGTINTNIGSLTAIIANIGTINTNVGSLTAIIANIETMNTYLNDLQAIITDIANIETQNIAIAGNVGTMNTNIVNLQAIIADIANIETQNIAIAGDINSLTAIIANIGTMNTYLTNLQAIIADIANIETQNIAIAGDVGTMNTNIVNLQAIITDIANIETQNIAIAGDVDSLTAIIANIGTMNTNIVNLQAIIADIASIETLNTTISGNITSLTAIIANIGTMNTNIGNLQAIITDIANIETQNISMNTAIATINTNIGTINTAITSIDAHQVDIDLNIASVEALDVDISEVRNKTTEFSGVLSTGTFLIGTINSDYIYNSVKIQFKPQDTNPAIFSIWLQDINLDTIIKYDFDDHQGLFLDDFYFVPSKYIKIYIINNSGSLTDIDYILSFFYAESPKPNEFRVKGMITASGTGGTSILGLDIQEKQLYNRISFTGYHATQAQDYTIEIFQRFKYGGSVITKLLKSVNITGSADSVVKIEFSFTPTDNFFVYFKNTGSYTCYITGNVFFSKNLEPELNEHIDDSTIHFLESGINLASIDEKNHISLANVSTSQHHVKTVSSDISLANLLEKLHTSLAGVSTSQHHVKTVRYTDSEVNNLIALRTVKCCRLEKTVAQSIDNNTWTTVNFNHANDEISDLQAWHNPAVNPSRITVDEAGIYLVVAGIYWAENVGGTRVHQFILTGTGDLGQAYLQTDAMSVWNNRETWSKVGQMDAGDYVEIKVYQNRGGSLNIINTSNTFFTVIKLGSDYAP